MCQQCETKPVYEFTNKRKVCKTCFIRWFEKKVFYTIRKFEMTSQGETISFEKGNGFRSVVLENVLETFSEKAGNKIVRLSRNKLLEICNSQSSSPDCSLKGNKLSKKNSLINSFGKLRVNGNEQANLKIATPETSDSIAEKIIREIIEGKLDMKKHAPIGGNVIKPLYLFLDKEVSLYAKLRGLKFKKEKSKGNKIDEFLEEMDKKHPELYHAVVNSYLELYS